MIRLAARLLFLVFCLFFWACTPTVPGGILSEEKMTDVLVDIHLAQGMAEAQSENTDVARYKYIQAVFRKHRITEAEFDSSMVYYSGRAEKFTFVYDNVVNRVQAQAERMGLESVEKQDQFESLTSDGDTANIWLGKDFTCLAANPVQCVYSFQMKADSTFKAGDYFIWRFRSQFVARSMNNEAIALLSFQYDTDTVAAVTDLIGNNAENELRHFPDKSIDSLNLRTISGYIYLPTNHDADKPKPLLINKMQLIRIHKRIEEKPVVETDTLRIDSVATDTLPQPKTERLTPQQVRESQPKEKKINVVKENPNPIRPMRGIPNRTNRRGR